jgi:hypothetical protein
MKLGQYFSFDAKITGLNSLHFWLNSLVKSKSLVFRCESFTFTSTFLVSQHFAGFFFFAQQHFPTSEALMEIEINLS